MNERMLSMNNPAKQLRSLLQRQYDGARHMLRILDQEHAAISGNRLQDMEQLLAAKQQSIAELESLSQEFLALALAPSSPAKGNAMAETLRQRDPTGTWGLESLWREVELLLTQCRVKNNVNGKVIALGHRRIQQALSILRGGELNAESCYGATGSRAAIGVSRTIGKV
jgi:flagellar biosynthesis/type III secretory pathway chaperone